MRTLVIILLLLVLSTVLPAQQALRQEIFGFHFGMSFDEAKEHAEKTGYTVSNAERHLYSDPHYLIGNWWFSLGLPLPTPEDGNNKRVLSFPGGTYELVIYRKDLPRTDSAFLVHMFFGDNKLYAIVRRWRVPREYNPDDLMKQLVKQYGPPQKDAVSRGGYGTRHYFLWTDTNAAMQYNYTFDDTGHINELYGVELIYLSLLLLKYFSETKVKLAEEVKKKKLEAVSKPEL